MVIEQQELEKLPLSELKKLKDSFNEEIEKLDLVITESKMKIEKLSKLKSIINKLQYHGNSVFENKENFKKSQRDTQVKVV